MVRVDWKAVAEEYITGEISMRSLAVNGSGVRRGRPRRRSGSGVRGSGP